MRCGAPVIAANTSSLPEVIGRADALFDPFSEDAIALKIIEGLMNNAFRGDLISHGLNWSQRFSWDECAKRAITAFEKFHEERINECKSIQIKIRRPKLAYVSPLPPEKSGISYYSAELLPELARHYDIEVIIANQEVSDPWIKSCLPIRTVDWFMQHVDRYDRILYQFGNSVFHQHMFSMLDRIPGVVVLHDFFLGNIKELLDSSRCAQNEWMRELYVSHGYEAVRERFHNPNRDYVVLKYPCNFSVVQKAVGVIVHSVYSCRLAEEWYGSRQSEDWATIPLLRAPVIRINRREARMKLGFDPDDFIICSFGLIGPTKQNHRLLKAWLNSSLAANPRYQLVFVGQYDDDNYSQKFLDTISQSNLSDRIIITGWVDAETFKLYLAAADMAVQLRTISRGETSATILDCLNHGLPTIVNANGSIAELPQDAVWMLPDEFKDSELVEALQVLCCDAKRRKAMSAQARNLISNHHVPRQCADLYSDAIEMFYAREQTGIQALIEIIAKTDNITIDERILADTATAIAQNMPQKRPALQILVDISILVQFYAKPGIQRVIRSLLKELLHNPPEGYRIEPVYAKTDTVGYHYARKFSLSFLDCPADCLTDEMIEANPGDIFLGLDLSYEVLSAQLHYLESLHNRGIYVYFIIYDLLPILLPYCFQEGTEAFHAKWLNEISRFDGALCLSSSVAKDLVEWLNANSQKRLRPFRVGWFHIGADIENSKPSYGLADNSHNVLSLLVIRPGFLLVGTIEPLKGQAQALAAFEQLWLQGVDVNLIFVGKQGCKVGALIERIYSHSERGKRLFWLEGISDEYLEKVYAASTCLIAASEGEGFGLPLVEAAKHRMPIIARNIPVFREVAGDHAFYFEGKEPSDLAKAVQEWLNLYQSDRHPKPAGIPCLTWKQSAHQMLDIILNDNWFAEWMPQRAKQ
jgi:glycosyltransferase involved in cell wall biosynthesis